MSNPASITLEQLFRYVRKNPDGSFLLPHQAAAVSELEADIRENGYPVAMRRDRPWFATWSQAGRQPDPEWLPIARDFVIGYEGFRAAAYPDPGTGGDPWTIGYGSTMVDGQSVRQGQRISQQEARQALDTDLRRFYDGMVRLLPMATRWNPQQRAAMVSFTYNIGLGALEASTLRKRMLAGEDPTAVVREELPHWINAGTPVEAGLRRRRAAEIALFTGGQPAPGPQEWATRIRALNLSQPDSQTCQATCIAMAVGDRDITGIRRRLEGLGSAGDPAVMRKVITTYGRRYDYAGNACLEDVYGWLRSGEFLITHGWFTGSGHVICLDGLRQSGTSHQLNVKDPWSEFNAQTWAYDLGSRFFDGFYSDRLIYATCVAGASRDDARAVFRRGVVDPKRRGMWVHRFIP